MARVGMTAALGFALVFGPGLALLPPTFVYGQNAGADYPRRPIRVLVTVTPGGAVDNTMRIVAEKLRQRWGQTVVVENRPGGGGTIAAAAVAAADPDGYTLLASHPGPIAATAMYRMLNYDPAALAPVAILAGGPMVVTVRKNLAASSIADLVAQASAQPGKLTFGSSGVGTISHLTVELLMARAGIRMGHAPYKGSAPATNDLIGGQIDILSTDVGTALAPHQAGLTKILAVAAAERAAALPEVPTMAEAGFDGVEMTTWFALLAPPGISSALADKLNVAVVESLASSEVRPQLDALKVEPGRTDLRATRDFIRTEAARLGGLIRAVKVTAEP